MCLQKMYFCRVINDLSLLAAQANVDMRDPYIRVNEITRNETSKTTNEERKRGRKKIKTETARYIFRMSFRLCK